MKPHVLHTVPTSLSRTRAGTDAKQQCHWKLHHVLQPIVRDTNERKPSPERQSNYDQVLRQPESNTHHHPPHYIPILTPPPAPPPPHPQSPFSDTPCFFPLILFPQSIPPSCQRQTHGLRATCLTVRAMVATSISTLLEPVPVSRETNRLLATPIINVLEW